VAEWAPATDPGAAPAVPETLRIATRRSPLALWQAEHVAARLRAAHPGLAVELVPMTTQGDRVLDSPLARIGGKGLFVKELERAMLEGRADLAVHSMKDVPVELPEGLVIAAVLEREDPRDALVTARPGLDLDTLPPGARVGTSSLRRQCQIRARRPDLEVLDLRGNVGTRLARLDEGRYDAIVLAAAGLRRLGEAARIGRLLGTDELLPAIGQGVIGVECRADDARTRALVGALEHGPTRVVVEAERAVNARLAGGCQVPLAAHAVLERGVVVVRGLVGRPDGSEIVEGTASGRPEDAAFLGRVLAEDLLARGADRILAMLEEAGGP